MQFDVVSFFPFLPLFMGRNNKILVQKFGGTSVKDAERIQKVAQRIKSYYEKGFSLVVVVSAMGKTTDNLVKLAREINPRPSNREMDVLLSTGEQVSIALLAIALNAIEVPAISFTGSQLNIMTDGNFANARIQSIDAEKLHDALGEGKVCIVAGFQGIDNEKNITTLGRGGSDTSAVALAAALEAQECEIFTDVTGVFTADPSKVPAAKKLVKISYEEMLEMASLGAKVLHGRAVEFAKKYSVILHVRSSYEIEEGTLVIPEEKIMEKLLVTGVSLKTDEARITIADIPDKPGVAADFFIKLADEKINVDMIVQSTGSENVNTISFTVLKSDLYNAKGVIESTITEWQSGVFSIAEDITIVSAVGIGMKSHAGIAAKMFKALADHDINIEMISTSEIKISCVIKENRGTDAMKIVHSVFDIDEK